MNKGSVLRRSLIVNESEIAKAHLVIINNLLASKLTNQEIDILNSFINIDTKIVEVDGRFGLISKREVRKQNNISASHLNNIINSLKEKNCLIDKGGVLEIQDYLVLKPDGSKDFFVEYNFILKIKDDKK